MPARIQATSVSHSYVSRGASSEVLKAVSFEAHPNELISFIGPSGCGKSTLFNIIAGLLTPTSGDILIDGEVTTGRPHPAIGYVLQKDLLLPWRTILDNVLLGLEVRGVPRAQAVEKARALLPQYHLAGCEDKYPSELSGGMRQRAALIRAIILDPSIILMDEAYKALDYPLKIALMSEFYAMIKAQRKTAILVTHDIEEAVTLSDRVYVLKARPGEIIDEISIDLETSSTQIQERRLAPSFKHYYQHLWQSIASQAA